MIMRGFLLLSLLLTASGCTKGPKEYQPYSATKRTIFLPAVRSAGAEPVYARTRWTHPPEVLPQRERPGTKDSIEGRSAPMLRPVFHLELKNASLEETARVLAATSRYESYADPSIALHKITIENLGTIDELGQIIERKAQIQVVIDHQNKEVRFLAPTAEQPRLFKE